jgi:hypothetical protein
MISPYTHSEWLYTDGIGYMCASGHWLSLRRRRETLQKEVVRQFGIQGE